MTTLVCFSQITQHVPVFNGILDGNLNGNGASITNLINVNAAGAGAFGTTVFAQQFSATNVSNPNYFLGPVVVSNSATVASLIDMGDFSSLGNGNFTGGLTSSGSIFTVDPISGVITDASGGVFGPVSSTAFTGNGSGITGLKSAAANSIFLATNGNDTSGARGTLNAFLTPIASIRAAKSGDVIYVSPGTYSTGTNLAKNGVTWQFSGPSCVFSNFADNNILGSSNAMFTDIYGATNFSVLGYPTIAYNTGTNAWGEDNFGQYDDLIASNAQFCFYTTNKNTTANIQISSGLLYTFSAGNTPAYASFNAATNLYFDCRYLICPYFGQVTNIVDIGSFQSQATGIGVYDVTEAHLSFKHIYGFDLYAYSWIQVNHPTTNNIYFTADEVNAKMYGSAFDNSYRAWSAVDWLNTSNSFAGYSYSIQGGFNYLTALKISDPVVGAVSVTGGASLWLNVQKIESLGAYLQDDATTNNIGGHNVIFANVLNLLGGGLPSTNAQLSSSATNTIVYQNTNGGFNILGQGPFSGNGSGLTNLQGPSVVGILTNQINTSNAIGPRVLACGRSQFSSGTVTVGSIYADTSSNTCILADEYTAGLAVGNHTANITNIIQGTSFGINSSLASSTNYVFWSVMTNK